jgi:hypothetical protein
MDFMCLYGDLDVEDEWDKLIGPPPVRWADRNLRVNDDTKTAHSQCQPRAMHFDSKSRDIYQYIQDHPGATSVDVWVGMGQEMPFNKVSHFLSALKRSNRLTATKHFKGKGPYYCWWPNGEELP